MLLRKLRSLLIHARSPGSLGPAIRRNIAQVRGRVSGRGGFVYRAAAGTPFVCFPENATSLRLFVKGYQEAAEMDAARTWLRLGDSCVDVGANVGLLSTVFAAAVGRDGHVLAFEPSPIAFSYLAAALRMLGLEQVTPIAACAADVDGMTAFYVACGDTDSEEESMRVSALRSAEFRRTFASCLRLNSVAADFADFATPSLVKVDVEGAEPLVLAGASEMLEAAQPPLVICEIHRTALANFGFRVEDILSYFPHDRFDLYFIPRSVSDETEERRHGAVYCLESPEQLPIYSNAVALPREADPSRVAALATSRHWRGVLSAR